MTQIDPLYDKLDVATRNIIENGVRDGSLRQCNPKIITFTLLGAINWMTRWYQIGGEMTTREVANEMVSLFNQGLSK